MFLNCSSMGQGEVWVWRFLLDISRKGRLCWDMALRSDISPEELPLSNRRGSGSKNEPAGVAETFSRLSVRRGFVGGLGFALVGLERARAICDAAEDFAACAYVLRRRVHWAVAFFELAAGGGGGLVPVAGAGGLTKPEVYWFVQRFRNKRPGAAVIHRRRRGGLRRRRDAVEATPYLREDAARDGFEWI